MHPPISDRFDLLRQIGAGAFGVVYEARDRFDGSSVAMKVLRDEAPAGDARFEREARLLAELRHPSIVRYVAHGHTEEGHAYLAMEWLDGPTLEHRLTSGPLSFADVVLL